MTDMYNDGIPDTMQGLGGVDGSRMSDNDSFRGGNDSFSRAMNNPGIRRGLRIGGRVATGYLVFSAVLTVLVLVFIAFVAVKI